MRRFAPFLLLAVLALPARGEPLDPLGYASLGALDVASGTLSFNTDTLAVSGAFAGSGVLQPQGAGLPDIAVFTFSSISIASGVTLSFTGLRPIALLSQGDATIAPLIQANGAAGGIFITVSGAGAGIGSLGGFDGGAAILVSQAGGQPGQGPGGGNAGGPGSGGAGGGYGGAGGHGGFGNNINGSGGGGPAYGDLFSSLQGGSGGGGDSFTTSNGAGGGSGAGAIEIGAAGALVLGSGVSARGGPGGTALSGGGGGGSGGSIRLHGSSVSVDGVLNAAGGQGGTHANQFGGTGGPSSGGGGGGGRVLVVQDSYTLGDAATLAVNVAGGLVQLSGGTDPPDAGTGVAGVAELRPGVTIIPTGQARQLGAQGTFSETAGAWALKTSALQVNAGALAFATQAVSSSHDLILNGGQAAALAGWTMTGAARISGFGTMSGALSGGAGNSIHAAGGTLTLGDANSASGFAFGGAIRLASGATLSLQDADGAELLAGGTLSAAGNASVDGRFVNQGQVNGPSGDARLTFLDDVSGEGHFTGNVLFSDGYAPGNSPAAVSFENFAMDASGSLEIELAGLAQGAGYDFIDVSGLAALDGTLEVSLLGGFKPSLGASFEIMRWGSRLGAFDSILGLQGEHFALAASYTDSSLVLTAVPEPESYLLLLAGLGLLGFAARRRK